MVDGLQTRKLRGSEPLLQDDQDRFVEPVTEQGYQMLQPRITADYRLCCASKIVLGMREAKCDTSNV